MFGYRLGDRPDIRGLLDHLRGGAGRLDLANDLHALAVTCRRDDVRSFREKDVKRYRPADADEAGRDAEMSGRRGRRRRAGRRPVG